VTNFWLGALTSRFRSPTDTTLVRETEGSGDYGSHKSPFGVLNLNDDAAYPPWAAHGGQFAFRHKLTANMLFVDGHVENITPSRGDLNQFSKYDFD
jgi:prepilin-type processing-associated H-X9-DG protein